MALINSLPNDMIRECMEIYPVFRDPDTPFQTLFQHAVWNELITTDTSSEYHTSGL